MGSKRGSTFTYPDRPLTWLAIGITDIIGLPVRDIINIFITAADLYSPEMNECLHNDVPEVLTNASTCSCIAGCKNSPQNHPLKVEMGRKTRRFVGEVRNSRGILLIGGDSSPGRREYDLERQPYMGEAG